MTNAARILIAALVALGAVGFSNHSEHVDDHGTEPFLTRAHLPDIKPNYIRVKEEMLARMRFTAPTISNQKNNTWIYRYSLVNGNPDIRITGITFQTTSHLKDGTVIEAGLQGIGDLNNKAERPDFWSCNRSTTCKDAFVIEVAGELHKRLSHLELTPIDFTGEPLREGVLVNTHQYGKTIHLVGEISRNWISELRHATAEKGPGNMGPTVFIRSTGGDINAAFEIGRIVRKAQARVVVNDVCASACVLILGAGWSRSVQGKIGIHRPYFSEHNSAASYTDIQKQIQIANTTTRQYLAEMNLPLTLLEAMNAVPPNQIKWLSEDQVAEFQLNQMDPAAQEIMDDRRAKQHGISRQELYRRDQIAEQVCDIEHWLDLGPWGAAERSIRCRMRVLATGR